VEGEDERVDEGRDKKSTAAACPALLCAARWDGLMGDTAVEVVVVVIVVVIVAIGERLS